MLTTRRYYAPDEPPAEPPADPTPEPAIDPVPEPVPDPVDEDTPKPWEFPTFDAPTPLTDPTPDPEDSDAWKREIMQGATQGALNAQFAVQQNYQAMRQLLAKQNASDDVIAVAEQEFWGLGPAAMNKANINAVIKYSVGDVATRGGQITRPRAKVTAPGAAPVGDTNPRSVRATDESAKALAAFQAVGQGLGIQFTEEDFAGVE